MRKKEKKMIDAFSFHIHITFYISFSILVILVLFNKDLNKASTAMRDKQGVRSQSQSVAVDAVEVTIIPSTILYVCPIL